MNDTKKTIDGDDPRLTAYALGELSPPERSSVETALRGDPSLLKEIDELQKLSLQLEEELSAEPLPALSSEAREAIEAEARKHEEAQPSATGEPALAPKAGRVIRFPFALKAAAGLLVAATGVGLLGTGTMNAERAAMSSARPNAALYDHAGDPADGPARVLGETATAFRETPPAEAQPVQADPGRLLPVGKKPSPRRAERGDRFADTYYSADLDADRRRQPAAPRTPTGPVRTGAVRDPSAGGGLVQEDEKARKPVPLRTRTTGLEQKPGAGGRVNHAPIPQAEPERTPPTSMRINVDVAEVDLVDVMEQISRQTGTNIIVSQALRNRRIAPPELTGNWRDAVELIAGMTGAKVDERSDGTVILVPSIAVARSTIDTPFMTVTQGPLSTFSIDVDTASYTTTRKLIKRHTRPNPDSVRIEEMINYFPYDYAPPAKDSEHPFAVHTEVANCPWKPGNKLVRVALKGREIDLDQRPTSNLVFLLDVSGSMNSSAKLPLLKKSLRMLLEQLGENDRVAIVVYAGASGLALPSTSCNEKGKIMNALERLRAGGSTNGGSGIQLAYHVAAENYIEGGINRVILCTDGDFNVGTRRRGDLVRLIKEKAKSNVFLTVLGFGMNHSDKRMESLADKGNGHYAFIDNEREGRKVLVEEMGGTLLTIAKDVKIQVEFNPALVASYRLIGYANRKLKARDFADDTKDAGEIGAGHSVTAFYEIVPVGKAAPAKDGTSGLKYQGKTPELTAAADSDELMTVKLRYKQPEGAKSTLLSTVIRNGKTGFWDASQDFRFAASVAAFGMLLRDSPFRGRTSFALIGEMAQDSAGSDPQGYRRELIQLVKKTQSIR